jgi:hypothetical protein
MMMVISAPALLGQPIASAIPPASIKEVVVQFGSLNKAGGPSDDAIRSLFNRCKFISDEEFHSVSLAPWTKLTVRTSRGDTALIDLMLGGLGTVRLDVLGERPFRCSS